MALSDACFEFIVAFKSASRRLARAAQHYEEPPFPYGEEIAAMRRACADVTRGRFDPEAATRVIRLAAAVLAYYDTLPSDPALADRQTRLEKLIEILKSDLDDEDAREVERLVPDVINETSMTRKAALRLKLILPKLGKSTYDIAIHVFSEIASETAKKILGLKP